MGMGILCTGKKAPVYGRCDIFALLNRPQYMGMETFLRWQKALHIWPWGHFALEKRSPYMGMGTLCTGKKAPIHGHGDTLH